LSPQQNLGTALEILVGLFTRN